MKKTIVILILLITTLSRCGTNAGLDPNLRKVSQETIEIRYMNDTKDTMVVYPFNKDPQSIFLTTRGRDKPISCLINCLTLIACDVKSFKVLNYTK